LPRNSAAGRTLALPNTRKVRRHDEERVERAQAEDHHGGPDGFAVQVLQLDLRPGGELCYAMTATAPAHVEFMKKAGMPLTTEARLTYTAIVPKRRLAYTHLADFIPGVESYHVETLVEFEPQGEGVRMVLTFDAMHNEEWTQRAVMGQESQLGKLARILAIRKHGG
jgi:hypothetical protein